MLIALIRFFSLAILLAMFPANAYDLDAIFASAIEGKHREQAFTARDPYRRPAETLKFFGLRPDMTVIEIWPARGWYAEILAPILRDTGTYYAASFATTGRETPTWRKKMAAAFKNKLATHPMIYDQVIVSELSVPKRTQIAPPNSADLVLTFRNVHNWIKGDYASEMFEIFASVLKPGGVLGVVEHRAKPGTSISEMIKSGYVTEEHVIALAQAAGFDLVARSNLLANDKDTTQHVKGVWTLPPSVRLCRDMQEGTEKANCLSKYLAIGESDRMALKFIKPL